MTHSHIARRSSFRLIKLNSDALVINDDQKLWTEVDLYITHAITDYTRKYNITAIVHCTRGMSKSFGESIRLFKPLVAAGMILVAFGILCIWIGTSVISFNEEGEGFKIIGIRFLIGGIVSITLGFLAKYYLFIKYLLKQISHKRRPEEDEHSGWYKP